MGSAGEAYLFEAVRTPRGHGGKAGALAGVRPVELVGQLLHALGERGLDPAAVDDLVLGCVTQVGDQGANVAKIAALWAGWPEAVPGLTLTRFCASGLDAIGMAAARVIAGFDGLIVAGGVESMSRVPMLADRGAWWMDPEVAERTRYVHMALSADLIASLDGHGREALDAWALRSHVRARAAWAGGHFARSVVPVRGADGEVLLSQDERVKADLSLDALAAKPPVAATLASADPAGVEAGVRRILARYPELGEGGLRHLHSRATAPAVVDGAALVVVGSLERGRALGLEPRARVVGYAAASVEPVIMLTATEPACRRALAQAGRRPGEVDLFEINESFSATVLRTVRALEVDAERVNVHGGAIAMGHPLGASGAILVGTLLDALDERRSVQASGLGVATLCAGAGLGTAVAIERC